MSQQLVPNSPKTGIDVLPKTRAYYEKLEIQLMEQIAAEQKLLKSVRDWLNDGQIDEYSIPIETVETKIEEKQTIAADAKAQVDATIAAIQAPAPIEEEPPAEEETPKEGGDVQPADTDQAPAEETPPA